VPSQQQLKWSQLKVGLTVLFAALVLALLIFLMTGSAGPFTKKIRLRSYFDNASGLRVGAPVRLQGVDIGNVESVRVVPGHGLTPVEVVMKVTTKYRDNLRKDSIAELSTAGVLGEVFVDIDSVRARGPAVENGDTLEIRNKPDLQDMVRASQTTLQNINALLNRVDRIVAFIETGNGSIGKLIYDSTLFNRLNATVSEFQSVALDVSQGKGSLGKLLVDDELYRKANGTVDKLNQIIDQINAGQGTAGKFLKDPALYENANATIAKANKLMEDVNAGKGALGLAVRDQAFAQKIDATVTKLNDLVTRLDSGEGSLGMLIRNPSFYNNTDQLLVESRSLIKAIRENPKKYLTIRLKVF
jgi:phospholipid/cholesterol/gamma-HCH transport system substrate-binding protein